MFPPSHDIVITFLREHWRLMASLSALALVFIIGTIFYCEYENWSVTDSVFFVIVTLSTIGYGQPAPSDDSSRLFTTFFILIGIILIIGSTNDLVQNRIASIKNWLCKSNTMAVAQEIECGDIYHYRRQLVYSLLALAVCVIVGASVMKSNEDWSWTEGFYFIIVTSALIGYGDLYIKEDSSKVFLCFYIIISTIILASTIKTFAAMVEEHRQLVQLEQRLTLLESLDFMMANSRGRSVSSHEVILQVLLHIGKVDHAKDVAPILKLLSTSGDGMLTQQQLQDYITRQRESARSKREHLEIVKAAAGSKMCMGMLHECCFGEAVRDVRTTSTVSTFSAEMQSNLFQPLTGSSTTNPVHSNKYPKSPMSSTHFDEI